MRIFLAGATGVIGKSLVPRLIESGHTVRAITRNHGRIAWLASLGAEGVLCDVYDAAAVEAAVGGFEPDVVVHQLTALPPAIDPRRLEEQLAANDRIRVEGTRNLVQAVVRAGVGRIVAQSIAFAYAPEGGRVKDEDAPLWHDAPWPWRRSVDAVAELERQVCGTEGVEGLVLRYGHFYGPGTAYAADGSTADLVRRRQMPIAGRGTGVFSFVHVFDAVSATLAAIECGRSGIYNVVDDEPAALRDWLPVYAEHLGAPRPRRVFAFLARLAAGRHGLYYMTEQRGASNAKARQQLGWTPQTPSWRTGFRQELSADADADADLSVIGVPAVAHGA